MRIVVLGATGMLGSMVTQVLSANGKIDVIATRRNDRQIPEVLKKSTPVEWRTLDASTCDAGSLAHLLTGVEWVVNAIGLIKPYIHDDNPDEVRRAIQINSLFPHLLARSAEQVGARVLQIATDCVYSGGKGQYIERDKHDALDVYGKTKSLGEVFSPVVTHLRCSIIGPEPHAHVSLLDWFLGQKIGARLNGFINHRWNGITTFQYAQLCKGIITNNSEMPHLLHIVPTGEITKCDLLKCFAKYYDRQDIEIGGIESSVLVDRTLATENQKLNVEVWKSAGYDTPPTMERMIEEMAKAT